MSGGGPAVPGCEVVQAAEELWGEIQEIAWDSAARALDLTEELLEGAAADGALEVRARVCPNA